MRKLFMGLTLVLSIFAFSVVNKKAQALPEAWEYGFGVYAWYDCVQPGCDWARCESGDGDCTYADQHQCCMY